MAKAEQDLVRKLAREALYRSLTSKLDLQMRAARIPGPMHEWKFLDSRGWRFDRAWPEILWAVEVEGGTFTGGRHVRGKGFEEDCLKYNSAALIGWRVLRFTAKMIHSGVAIRTIEAARLDLEMKKCR